MPENPRDNAARIGAENTTIGYKIELYPGFQVLLV